MIETISRPPRPPKHAGFTLIELLVVIAVIAILVALLLPAAQQVREAARRSQCRNHLKQIGLALHNYHETFGTLPPGNVHKAGNENTASVAAWGWGAFILPQVEQSPLFDRLQVNQRDLDAVLRDNTLNTLTQTPITVFRCPSDTAPERNNKRSFNDPYDADFTNGPAHLATSNYIAVHGTRWSTPQQWIANGRDPFGTFWGDSSVRFRDITDGTSNTFFVGERDWDCLAGVWPGVRNYTGNGNVGNRQHLGLVDVKLNDPALDASGNAECERGFSSKHPGGGHFVLGDGRVMFVSENIHFDNTNLNATNADAANMGLYQRLGRRNDGQTVGEL